MTDNDPMLSQGIEPTSGLEPQLWMHIKPNCHVLIRVAWNQHIIESISNDRLSNSNFVDHSIEEGHIYFEDGKAILLFKESVLLPRSGLYRFELRIFEEFMDVYLRLHPVQRIFSIKLNRVEGDLDFVPVKRLLLWKILEVSRFINRQIRMIRNE